MSIWKSILDFFKTDINKNISSVWGLKSAQTDFISMATHQLKTPLSEIKWTINMITSEEAGPLNEEQKKWLKKAYMSNERVIKMVDHMLSAIRMENKNFELYRTRTDLEQIVDREIEEISPLTKNKNITLKYESRYGNKRMYAYLDPDRFQSALQGILENAVQYTHAGGKVMVLLERFGNKARIVISDTGIGIPEEVHPKIFSQFFRARNAFKVQSDGTGLGLFIARGIIEGHGGKVHFESQEGKGTTFFITLPLLAN